MQNPKITKADRRNAALIKKEKAEMKPYTFSELFTYLKEVIKWRFSNKKWIGTRIFIAGKMRPVTHESFEYITVKGLSHQIRKDSRYFKVT
jgi:hypothetical protein